MDFSIKKKKIHEKILFQVYLFKLDVANHKLFFPLELFFSFRKGGSQGFSPMREREQHL